MKINSVNNTFSFGRAIKINSVSNSDSVKNPYIIDKSTKEIENVLNNKTSYYNKNHTEQIKNFFINILGDYDGNNLVLFRKIKDGTIVLLSGKDAEDIKRYEEHCRKNCKKENDFPKKDRMILKRLENGFDYKPESTLTFLSTKDKTENKTIKKIKGRKHIFTKLDYIVYSNLVYTYTENQDGFLLKGAKEIERPNGEKTLMNIAYDQKELKLN